jgi:cytochrome c oxidase subunit 3
MSDAASWTNTHGEDWTLPSRGSVGIACLIVAESAIFIIVVVAYIFLHRQKPERTHST